MNIKSQLSNVIKKKLFNTFIINEEVFSQMAEKEQLSENQEKYWLHDRKYLRLRNVELSYDFPQLWTRKFYVNNLRIGFIGQNLLTWAPFKWWDPEGTREDGSNYPINKTFSCYLQFSF